MFTLSLSGLMIGARLFQFLIIDLKVLLNF